MKIHVITIGDEILNGYTMNTNAAYIGSEFAKNELKVSRTSVVGDNEPDIINELRECLHRNDVVIATGGLGPTHDDITKDCVVRLFNTELVLNNDVLNNIKSIFSRKGREMSSSNEGQAYVPKNARVINNSLGTAPGLWIEREKKILIALPGVPHEMKEMIQSYVIPELGNRFKDNSRVTKVKSLSTTGITESVLYEKLGDIKELMQGAKLAFLPDQYGVQMRIVVEEESSERASNKISEIEQRIRSLVGRYIFGIEGVTLEEVISRLLKERGLSIAVAESCTGGKICDRLTNISGSSAYFERGVVSYSNGAKVELLKVNEDMIAAHGAVSLEVVRQMAEGVKAIAGTDLGLAVTGILGPTGAVPGKPVGLVYIGICDDKLCTAKKFQFSDSRMINKEKASQAALDFLRRHLLGIPYDE